MIVTCERCATQFQLDEAKISPDGARVRCSRCEHAFFVESPDQADADHAHGLVRDLVDTTASESEDSPCDDAPKPTSVELDEPSSMDLEAGEDDWEFNDDSGAIANEAETDAETTAESAADDLSAAREAVDDLLGETPESPTQTERDEEAFQGLDIDGIDADSADDLADIASDTKTDDIDDFDDFDTFDEDEVSPIDDAQSEPIATFDEDGRSEPLVDQRQELEPVPQAKETDADDFEDPADWDLFDSETGETAVPGALESELAAQPVGPVSDTPIGSARVPLPEGAEAKQTKLRLLGAAGWTVAAALVAVCLVGGLSAQKLPAKPGLVASATSAGFELQGISARWIDNAVGGPLYVISGEIRRSKATSARNVAPLGVLLLDSNGQSLELPLAPVGPAISEQTLRETSPVDLAELQNGKAAHLAATANSWLSFAAVVPELPLHAEGFEFRALNSDSGS